MTIAPGTKLGPYEILSLLGAGGMGEVYRAKDTRLGRDVAIKVLPPAFAEDAERLRRFDQEAKAVGSLSHPNILAVHDIGLHNDSPYMVTELLEGETLRAKLRGKSIATKNAVEIAKALAQGLAAAHEKGIVHRDLKPENVFITKSGWVKILDFGIAKSHTAFPGSSGDALPTVGGASSPVLTEEGIVLGTVGYMSPEQIRGGKVDGRSDLFTLGVVLHEMLAGLNPFRRDTAADTMAAVLREEPKVIPVAGGFSQGLSAILERCLAKTPEQRFQSAKDLAVALESCAQPSVQGEALPDLLAKSIVVLPFENLSPDPDNAYFADGLTEEIIADLSKVHALRVISRRSAMHFKGTTKQLPEIAGELKVRYVLEGSVRRAGHTLRITAQLIEAATDTHLWAEKYSGTFEDVFDMQEKVSRAIVEALQVHLSPQEDRKLAARPLPNAAAYDSYLRAYQDIMLWNPEALKRAEQHLENAFAIVGEHPLLLAGRSMMRFQTVNLGLAQDGTVAEARECAERALVLDPTLAQGHTAMAMVGMLEGNYPKSIRHFRQARSEAPGDVAAWGWLPFFFCCAGKVDAAAPLAEEVLRLDPFDPNWHLQHAAVAVYAADFEEGARRMAKALRMAPGAPIFLVSYGNALAVSAQRAMALEILGSLPADPGVDIWVRMGHLLRAALTGDPGGFDALLTNEAVASLRRDGEYSYHLTSMTMALGRTEEALDWLENAVDRTFVPVHLFLHDPFLAPLASLPRFKRIIARALRVQASVPDEP